MSAPNRSLHRQTIAIHPVNTGSIRYIHTPESSFLKGHSEAASARELSKSTLSLEGKTLRVNFTGSTKVFRTAVW